MKTYKSKYISKDIDRRLGAVDKLQAQVADVVNKIENIEKDELSWIEVQ